MTDRICLPIAFFLVSKQRKMQGYYCANSYDNVSSMVRQTGIYAYKTFFVGRGGASPIGGNLRI